MRHLTERKAIILIKDGERLDDLELSNLKIIQNPEKFCFGMDAVLLSGFASAKAGHRVLDLCTGTGIIPLLMSAKTKATDFTALEIQEESVDMARRSVELNGLTDVIKVIRGDVCEASKLLGAGTFDVVTVNPPYMTGGHGIANPSEAKAIARHEVLCTLDDVCREAAACLKTNGHLYMVHRPFRLAEIVLKLSKYKLEMKRMRLVYPYVDSEPNMVLIEAAKGGRPRVTVEPPLIVWEKKDVYSAELREKYGY